MENVIQQGILLTGVLVVSRQSVNTHHTKLHVSGQSSRNSSFFSQNSNEQLTRKSNVTNITTIPCKLRQKYDANTLADTTLQLCDNDFLPPATRQIELLQFFPIAVFLCIERITKYGKTFVFVSCQWLQWERTRGLSLENPSIMSHNVLSKNEIAKQLSPRTSALM